MREETAENSRIENQKNQEQKLRALPFGSCLSPCDVWPGRAVLDLGGPHSRLHRISPRAKAESFCAHRHILHPSPHACSAVQTCSIHVPVSPLPQSYVSAASYFSRLRMHRHRGH